VLWCLEHLLLLHPAGERERPAVDLGSYMSTIGCTASVGSRVSISMTMGPSLKVSSCLEEIVST